MDSRGEQDTTIELDGGLQIRLPEALGPQKLVSAIIEAANVAVFIKDREGRYLLVNRKLGQLWGRPIDELIGRRDAELFPEEVVQRLRRNDAHVFETGESLDIEEKVEFGGRPYIYFSSKAPLHDDHGQVHAVLGIATDISNLKSIELALRESEARFRAMADSAPVLIWMSDPDNKGVFFNARWLSFTGRSVEDELGGGWLENVHPDDAGALEACQDAFRERRRFRAQFRMRRHDGKYCWMLDSGVPHYEPDGRFAGFIGSCIDITDRILLEKKLRAQAGALEENDRRKDEFLAMLGHELRNPMAPLQHVVELLQSRAESFEPDLRHGLDIADRQLRHLRRIVDDLLDVARITRGQLHLSHETLPLQRAVETAIDTVGPMLRDKDQTLQVEASEDAILVEGDETRLTQVAVNLLRNASKYSEAGTSIRIDVDAEEDQALLRVSDAGIGIDPELLATIFGLFEQSPRSLDRTDGGLGVGLTLVKRLVEMHGGEVLAESEGEGRGSTFTVRLPLARAQPQPSVAEETTINSQATDGKQHVLVVDDNRDAADSLGMLLTLEGYEVDSAYDGQQALEAVGRHDPDIIVLDIGLPGIDGYEVARRLREDGCTARIIALTGYGQENDVKRAKACGFDAHLLKPVDGATLRSTLRGFS